MLRTRVKICGITNLEDAQAALDYGAHALGFNLSDPPNGLPPQEVRVMARALAPFAVLVGVCGHRPTAEIRELLRQSQLDVAQLPAEATTDDCRLLRQRFRVIKTEAIGPDTTAESLRKNILALASAVDGILLDFAPLLPPTLTAWSLPWNLLQSIGANGPPLMVAARLNPANVAELLRQFRPYALDVGPELELPGEPGRKHWGQLRHFLRAVKRETRKPLP